MKINHQTKLTDDQTFTVYDETGQPIRENVPLSVARGIVKFGVMFGGTYTIIDNYGHDVTREMIR